MSLSELSRRSGTGQGTISELEERLRGCSVDTLFGLTIALDAPLGALLPDGTRTDAERVAGESITAVLLGQWRVRSGVVEVYRVSLTSNRQNSPAHAVGIEEIVTVVQGYCSALPASSRSRAKARVFTTPVMFRTGFRHLAIPPRWSCSCTTSTTHLRKGMFIMTDAQQLPERSQIVQQHLVDASLTARVRELPDSTRTAAEAAAALGCEVGAIASSLLFLADEEPLLVMTSGRHHADADILAAQVGATTIEMP